MSRVTVHTVDSAPEEARVELKGLDAGWTTEELTELSTHIALNLFTNYFNHMVQTDLDIPAAPGL